MTANDPAPEDVYLNGCPVEVWDGPYLMRCAMGVTRCATHGPFERAKRCDLERGCRRPAGHGGRCNPPVADPTPTGGLPRVSTGGCLYGEDEPVGKIQAAFDGGEKGVTAAPDCRTRRRCPIPDDPCGPGGARPYCWEEGR